ncbi:MAG: hypothetical protein RXR20_32045 [Paraburkholderia sp.]
MAEALLRELGAERFEAFSAGIEPADDVHPLTLAQLRPTMGDLGKVRPKSWSVYTKADAPVMDVVIAMCEEAGEAHAPAFPGKPIFCQWNFAKARFRAGVPADPAAHQRIRCAAAAFDEGGGATSRRQRHGRARAALGRRRLRAAALT